MATWYSLKKGSTAGNISMDVEYGITSVERTSTTNVKVTYGIRFKQSSSNYTYNSVAAFIPKDGTRRYAFNSNSGGSHTSSGTWYYAYTDGKTRTSEYASFTQNITVTVQQTSASFDVGFGWNAWTPSQKGTGTITVTFPVGATAPTGLSCSVSNITETTCTLSGAYTSDGNATVTDTGYQYSTDKNTWTNCTANVTGLTPGAKYYFRYYATNSQGTSYSDGSCNATMYNYPYIVYFNNAGVGNNALKIGTTPSINLYNPLKRSCTVYIKQVNTGTQFGSVSSGLDAGSGNYNVPVVAETMYRSIPSAKTGTMYAYVVSSSPSHTSGNVNAEYTIKNDGTENPTFTANDNITNVRDTNTTTVGITGNSSKFIKGHSTLSGTIKKMTTTKWAGLTNGYYSISATASSTSPVNPISYSSNDIAFTITNITTNSFKITAVDERGLSTEATKSITLVDYSKPTLTTWNITRQNGIGDHIYLNLQGKYTNWSGLSQTNGIQTIRYRSKVTGTNTWGQWYTITGVTNSNGTWTLNNKLLDETFDNTKKYDIQVEFTDRLESNSSSDLKVSTANALLWRDLSNKRVGIGKKPNKPLDVAGDINSDNTVNGNIITEQGYQLTEIDISETSQTILSRVQDLATHKIYQANWVCLWDGASSGISDKPTGSTNAGFVCYANCNRHLGSSDWRYILRAFVQGGLDEYLAVVTNATTSISWVKRLQNPYMVGSIYISAVSTDPGTIFGGQWTQLKNHFLFATNATSGNKGKDAVSTSTGTNVTGTALSTDQIPAHTHGSKSISGTFRLRKSTGNANEITHTSGIVSTSAYSDTNTTISNSSTKYGQQTITINATHEHDSVGGGGTHNHEVPYIEVYVWQRTS